MKNFIKRSSIKRKIMLITLGTSCLVMMLVSFILITSQLVRYRQDLQNNLAIIADMVSFSSVVPLMFGDSKSADAALSSLSTNPTIMDGHILNAEGIVFATYQSPAAHEVNQFLEKINGSGTVTQRLALLEGLGKGSFWQVGSRYELVRPIISDGRNIGFVVLHSSTAPLRDMFFKVVSFSAVVLLFALLLIYLIVSRLQTMITEPIVSLARTMLTVSDTRDYSLRVVNENSDETGQLIDGFNEMLGQIEERDTKLELQRDTLETTVEVRTEELRQMVADLELARDAAEAASRSKSEFLANMSHEIRTPMFGVLGMTELLLGTPLAEKQLKYTQTIHDSGTSLLGIINDILDFSKIEAGKIELENVFFDPRDVLNRVVELVMASVAQKGLDLRLSVDEDVPQVVSGDPLRVRQVLLNLVSNAVKFTEVGEVEVVVSVADRSHDEVALCFSIRDTGIGIQPEVLSKIFEGFSQADGTMTRKYGGTGLGLTIAKQLAEMLGGSVSVKSTFGVGSCFRFKASFGCQSAAQAVDVIPETNVTTVETTGRGRGSILLVEDNPVNQCVGREMLELLGYDVTVAVNGREALGCLARERFVLILMDCQMPVLDGYSLTRLLREQEIAARSKGGASPRQVVVALTGHAREEDRQICIDAGMDDYLSKPFSMKQLEATLSRWLVQESDRYRPPGQRMPMSGTIPELTPYASAESPTPVATAWADEDSPLDRHFIDSIRMLDPGGKRRVLHTVVSKYIEDAPRVLADLQLAARVNDMDGVFRNAHDLKSSSANLGAIKLSNHCKTLESIGKNATSIEDATLITRLESEFGAVTVALAALLQGEIP